MFCSLTPLPWSLIRRGKLLQYSYICDVNILIVEGKYYRFNCVHTFRCHHRRVCYCCWRRCFCCCSWQLWAHCKRCMQSNQSINQSMNQSISQSMSSSLQSKQSLKNAISHKQIRGASCWWVCDLVGYINSSVPDYTYQIASSRMSYSWYILQ